MNKLESLRTRAVQIREQLDALEAKDDATEEDETRADALLEEWDETQKEMEPLATRAAKIAEVRKTLVFDEGSSEETEEGGDGGPAGASWRSKQLNGNGGDNGGELTGFDRDPSSFRQRFAGKTPDLIARQKLDPYRELDAVRMHSMPVNEVRARAAYAVEQYANRDDHWALEPEAAEHVTQLIYKRGKNFGKHVSEQILVTGSPEYLASFEQYMSDPGGFSTRAALSLTPANGGYLVPFTLDPTIILTNAGSANPYRQVATIKTTTTNDWNGVTSAGVSAEWTAEGVEAADATPTVGTLKITPQKADAYLFGSFEVLSDSDIAQQLPGLLADAKDRLEETAFAVGTGTGQPAGIITRGTVLAAAAGTAATGPTAADLYALQAALPARWRGPRARNVWVGNLTVINRGRQLPSFTGSTVPMVTDNGGGTLLLGKPLLESTSVTGAFANGNKVLAYLDASQFYIVDRVGMSVIYDPVVLGSNRRPTGQGAWYAFWRTGSDVSVATAVRVLSLTT